MEFLQAAPILADPFRTDAVLGAWIASTLPPTMQAAIAPDLAALGAHAVEAWNVARARQPTEPALVQWSAWGERIDRIELTPAWQAGPAIATGFGLVASGHDAPHGEYARCDQFLRVYLYHVASEFFTCPLAMSDGAATALKASGNTDLAARVLPRLLARDPARLWLSGQWMTETAGGSDVGSTQTEAHRDGDGRWRLYGRKWFTSAVVGDMALTLARPDGAGDGADALALFHLETRDADGRWNGIRIDRLKDKLGTRELPTAEIHLDGVPAVPVGDLAHGVRRIAPMLNITRTWNAVCALATMRRCLALAGDYAQRRRTFGRALAEQPLHAATLAGLDAEFHAAFHLVFEVAHRLGRAEHGLSDPAERGVLRVLTPLIKLWTGRLAVRVASETCEAFGGAGYIEDTGIPQLLRDAQVFPIWEGTTNVLALDTLRALGADGLAPLRAAVRAMLAEADGDPAGVEAALARCDDWLQRHAGDRVALEAGARGFALSLARCLAAAVLTRHALRHRDTATLTALRRFAAHGLLRLVPDDSRPDDRGPDEGSDFAAALATMAR